MLFAVFSSVYSKILCYVSLLTGRIMSLARLSICQSVLYRLLTRQHQENRSWCERSQDTSNR